MHPDKSHKVATWGIRVPGSENKFSVRYFCKGKRRKVEAMSPRRKWLVQYVTSDRAPAMGGSAHKVWRTLVAWLQCVYRNFKRALFPGLPGRACKKERLALYRCLQTIRCSWSPTVKDSGWNAFTNRLSTRLEHLAHIKEQYVDQRSNWPVGNSPAGIPAATFSEPHAHMLEVATDHRRSTSEELLQVTLPKIAMQWTSPPFAFSGRGSQPEPWMWQDSQALPMASAFFNDGDALFLIKEIAKKKEGLNAQPIKEYRPIDGAAVAEWKATLRKIEERDLAYMGGICSSSPHPPRDSGWLYLCKLLHVRDV